MALLYKYIGVTTIKFINNDIFCEGYWSAIW